MKKRKAATLDDLLVQLRIRNALLAQGRPVLTPSGSLRRKRRPKDGWDSVVPYIRAMVALLEVFVSRELNHPQTPESAVPESGPTLNVGDQ